MDQEELRDYVQARLKVFYEEELDVPLVLFNEVLDHVLRIDRIFKQTQVRHMPSTWRAAVVAIGTLVVDWGQRSRQDHSLQVCGVDQWTLCLPN